MANAGSTFDDIAQKLAASIEPKYEIIWPVLRLHKGTYHPDDEAFVKQAGMDGFQIVSTVGQSNGSVVVFMSRRIS